MNRNNAIKVAASAVALLLGLLVQAPAQSVWNNAAGGDYYTPGNWTPSGVPATSATATFNATGTASYTVTTGSNIVLDRAYVVGDDTATLDLDNGSPLSFTVNQIRIGTTGGIGSLIVDGGTTTVNSVLYLGNIGGGGGSGSTLALKNFAQFTVASTVGSNFVIGQAASNANNSVSVESGADLSVNIGSGQSVILGAATGASGNSLTVTGTGSTMTMTANAGSLLILGSGTDAGGNTVNILNGGAATVSTLIRLGASNSGQQGTAGNSVVVDGAGSSFVQTGGGFNIGFGGKSATATNNSLIVQNSGVFTTSQSVTVFAGSENRIEVLSNGQANLNNTTNAIEGSVLVNGGDFNANGLSLAATGVFDFRDGTADITGNLSAASNARFKFSLLPDELTMGVTGSITVSGPAFIDIGEFTGGPGVYTLFTFGSATGLGNFELGDTPIGFDGSFSFDSNAFYLNVVPEPAVASLAAMGILALIATRRKSARHAS